MSATPSSRVAITVYAISILGSLFIVFGLVKAMQFYTRPPEVTATRIEDRRKALAEQRVAEKDLVENYVLMGTNQVRLPVAKAMEISVREYQNPAVARSNLLARLEKFTALPVLAPATSAPPVSTAAPPPAAAPAKQ